MLSLIPISQPIHVFFGYIDCLGIHKLFTLPIYVNVNKSDSHTQCDWINKLTQINTEHYKGFFYTTMCHTDTFH